MKFRDFIPPVVQAGFERVAKSFAASVAAWTRGDDLDYRPATKMVSPYAQSTWVFSAVNMVSGEFAGLDLEFYQGETQYQDATLDVWWQAPALGNDKKRIGRDQVDRLLTMWLLTEGEYFLLLDDSWVITAGKRNPTAASPFIVARPDRVRLIVYGGELQGYEWIDAGGKRHVFVPEQVIHRMEPNPHDDWRGLGRNQVAKVAIEGSFLTGNYIRELMRNNGDQGFIVIGKNGVVGDDQRKIIVAALREKRIALQNGQPRDIFLTGDITVDRPTEQAAGVDLANTAGMSHQEIFIAFGVPPSFSTIKQSYSIGKDSDRYQLVTGTSQPMSRTICRSYADIASRQTGKALTACHDWDDHPVMQEVRSSRIDQGLKLWGAGWSWEDINDYLSLGAAEFPGWDQRYLPFSVSPVDSGTAPEKDETLAEPPPAVAEDDAIKTLRTLLLVRQRTNAVMKNVTPVPLEVESDALAGFTCGCHFQGKRMSLEGGAYVFQKADRDPKEIALWKQHMAGRREQVKGFESRFRASLFKARAETLRNIQKNYSGKGVQLQANPAIEMVARAAVADLLFDLANFAADFTAGMRKQHKLALDAAGKQVQGELGKDDPFTFAAEDVKDFIDGRTNKLSGVSDDIFARIRDSIKAGFDAGDSTDDLAKRVRTEFNAIDKGRSQVIAQTETAAAYGYGRNAAMEDAGVEYKAWLTSGNSNVRTAHQEAGLSYPQDGGIPLDEPFIVDGEELMYPGDESGSPGNTINCHCVQIAVRAPADL